MPRNPNFTLDSPTLGTVYETAGVLVSAGAQTIREPFVGAYYDTAPATKGLYVVLPDGDVYYFDIEDVNIQPQGTNTLIRFDNDGTNYLLRPVYNDDGEWMSKYKIELPVELLSQKIALDAHDAIEKFLGVDLGDPLPFFETLYAYYEEGFPNVVSLTYISSLGTFSRLGASWTPTNLEAPMYDNWVAIEIDPEMASALLDKYDEQGGVVSVEDALGASLDSAK